VWTAGVSGKKKLRIRKYPDTCGRGLSKTRNKTEQKEIKGGTSKVQTTEHCILQRSLQILDADDHNDHYFVVDVAVVAAVVVVVVVVETDLSIQYSKLCCENPKSLSVKDWNIFWCVIKNPIGEPEKCVRK